MKNTSQNNFIIIAFIVVALLSFAYFLSSKNKDSSELTQFLSTQELPIPSFEWFDNTYTPIIRNKKELSEIWKSKARCCTSKRKLQKNNREFYKGCYVAILKFPDDDDIEANCLWLMDVALESREERLKHNE